MSILRKWVHFSVVQKHEPNCSKGGIRSIFIKCSIELVHSHVIEHYSLLFKCRWIDSKIMSSIFECKKHWTNSFCLLLTVFLTKSHSTPKIMVYHNDTLPKPKNISFTKAGQVRRKQIWMACLLLTSSTNTHSHNLWKFPQFNIFRFVLAVTFGSVPIIFCFFLL